MGGEQPEQQGIAGKKRSVAEFLKRNMLVSPDFLNVAESASLEEFHTIPADQVNGLVVVNEDTSRLLRKDSVSLSSINWLELERSRVLLEKLKSSTAYNVLLGALLSQEKAILQVTVPSKERPGGLSSVKVVFSYTASPTKRQVGDFVNYYIMRYKAIQGILMQRAELSSLVQIARVKAGSSSESVSVIGLVNEKRQTKQGHIIITLEDQTGTVDAVVNKTKGAVFELAQNLIFDEVVAVTGSVRNGTLFVANITHPDVPLREQKHAPNEGYAAFMSDLHFGSAQFLEEDFRRFIKWINGNLGSASQREIASKVKYIFIAGDIVDGVGVYQDQYDELILKDVKEQYRMCAEFLSEIPPHISIILSPGNHDAVRAAEPQAQISGDFAAPLLRLPNVIPVSNPAVINIDASEKFPGFDVLVYHGYSFDYYVANVDAIRKQGGYDRADLLMKFLLQRRHLAPAHTSTLILPDPAVDPLFIGTVPDIFVTGHVHRTSVSEYKGITLINSSCWQGKTKFQERLGHNPQPSKLPLLNLKTRAVKIINFGK
ncbi:metallophosphoesterase [Candidatus Woesearchaeota archaeon]|nr:metallophosphoesterase [Candidatus Woesearchaeota archaeon]